MTHPFLPGLEDERLSEAFKGLVDRFGRDPTKIKKWTREKTIATYHALVKEEQAALNRAMSVATQIDGGGERKVPNMLRWAAADTINQALKAGLDETMMAMGLVACYMTDEELKTYAQLVARLLNEGRPATQPEEATR